MLKFIFFKIIFHNDTCRGLRTKDGYNKLWLSLQRHCEPKEGIYPRIGGEETKDFWEVWMRRMGFRERIVVAKGNFQWKFTYCLRIKWLATYLSAALMRKWPEQWNSQLSNSFYHLQQKFKGDKCHRKSLGKWARRARM